MSAVCLESPAVAATMPGGGCDSRPLRYRGPADARIAIPARAAKPASASAIVISSPYHACGRLSRNFFRPASPRPAGGVRRVVRRRLHYTTPARLRVGGGVAEPLYLRPSWCRPPAVLPDGNFRFFIFEF